MKVVREYQIGSVPLRQLEGADIDSSRYSDGDSEDILFKIFSSKNPGEKINKVMSDNPSWPIYYHLSPYRKNVIEWYDFKPGSEVLEIGAGCGAITEALCSKGVEVTALELTKRRAETNAHRNRDKNNLEVIVGNLEEYEPDKKFDYIVCVGVLEYAGIFINSKKPYDEFLSLLSSFLKPDGQLIIAIENRLGLKYLSGSREDHTGRFYDGINQYPYPKKVQTFGRKELTDLITNNGFSSASFHYPYPDYKNPQVVYSDQYYPGKNSDFPIKILPTKSHDQKNRNRVHVFSEQLAMLSVEKNDLYRELANSFVVIANKGKISDQDSTQLFFTNTPNRKEQYKIKTYLLRNKNGSFTFYKEAENEQAINHIDTIFKNYSELKKTFNKSKVNIVGAKKVGKNKLSFNFIEGKTLERLLYQSIVAGDMEQAIKLLDKFISIVEELPGKADVTDCYLIDLNFDNIIIDQDDNWNFIDYEWLQKTKVNKKIIVQRSLMYFINRYSPAFKYLIKRGDYLDIAKDWYLPAVIYTKYKDYFLDTKDFKDLEIKFLKNVNRNFNDHPVIKKVVQNSPTPSVDSHGLIEDYIDKQDKLSKISHHNNDLIHKNQQQQYQLVELRAALSDQMSKTRRAELTSFYYLPRKILGRVKRIIMNKGNE